MSNKTEKTEKGLEGLDAFLLSQKTIWDTLDKPASGIYSDDEDIIYRALKALDNIINYSPRAGKHKVKYYSVRYNPDSCDEYGVNDYAEYNATFLDKEQNLEVNIGLDTDEKQLYILISDANAKEDFKVLDAFFDYAIFDTSDEWSGEIIRDYAEWCPLISFLFSLDEI